MACLLIIFTSVTVGASLCGRSFRIYSFATLFIMVVFGVLASFASRGLATGQPTPWLGVTERINIGAFLLWVALLAISLLRALAIAGAGVTKLPGRPTSSSALNTQ